MKKYKPIDEVLKVYDVPKELWKSESLMKEKPNWNKTNYTESEKIYQNKEFIILKVKSNKKIGFIFQQFHLLPKLSALENVELPLIYQGMPTKKRREKAVKALKAVGLEKRMNHKPNQLSGGQQQRVGVARALVVDPKIIFADEPTGNLDSKTTKEILGLMRKIVREQNQTLVMVTHDNYIAGFADRQLHIVDGKIFKIEEQHHDDTEEETENEEER